MNPRILIVEDDSVISTMYASKLQMSGYDVEIAENGADGYLVKSETTPASIVAILNQLLGVN